MASWCPYRGAGAREAGHPAAADCHCRQRQPRRDAGPVLTDRGFPPACHGRAMQPPGLNQQRTTASHAAGNRRLAVPPDAALERKIRSEVGRTRLPSPPQTAQRSTPPPGNVAPRRPHPHTPNMTTLVAPSSAAPVAPHRWVASRPNRSVDPSHLRRWAGEPDYASPTTGQQSELVDGRAGYIRFKSKTGNQGSGGKEREKYGLVGVVWTSRDCRTRRARVAYASGRLRHRSLTHRSAFAATSRRRSRSRRWAVTTFTGSGGAS